MKKIIITGFLVVFGLLGFAYYSSADAMTYACSDTLDNDGDGYIDYPADPGCASLTDTNEFNALPMYECSDGLDNDGDGYTDYPADPGCYSVFDDSEYNVPVLPDGNIKVKFISSDVALVSVPGSDNDTGTFSITVSIKAIGEDAYISPEYSFETEPDDNKGHLHGGATLIEAGSYLMTSTADETEGNFEIEEGEVETFTFIINYTKNGGSPDGTYQAFLKSIKWNNSNDDGFFDYNNKALNVDIFKTDAVFLD